MLTKLLGIIFLIVGGAIALGVLFPLIGSLFGMLFLLVKLAVAVVFLYVGYRMLTQDQNT